MDSKLKTAILFAALLIPLFSMGQCRSLSKLYNNYNHLDETFSLNISGGFLKMANWVDDHDDEDIHDVIRHIDQIKIYKIPKGYRGIENEEVRRFKRDLVYEDFEELMNIRKGEEVFYVMVKERRGTVNDLVIYGEADDAVVFIEFLGAMNSKKLAKLCRKIEFNAI